MATNGTFRFPELAATPSVPPAGYALVYVKTDNVIYILDSGGVEVALGSSSSITSLTGEASAVGPGAAAVTLSNSAIIGKVLTGFVAGPNSPVLATDTILAAFQKLQSQVSATIGAAVTALTGDVSATGPGSVAATVNSVGGSSAANINTATIAANAATSANTASTIVKRDASGDFSANIITAALTGNVTGNVSGTAANVTGIVAIVNGGTNSSVALNNNRVIKSAAGAIVEAAAITAARALISDVNGIPTHSVTTDTELGYVSGVTSAIQTQLNSITGAAITQLTGDVTAIGPGSVASSVAKIQGTTVSGTTGSINVVLSNAPTLTGLLSGSSASFSSTISASNLSGTNTGDVTITDTDSIDLTLTGQNVTADLKLSSDAADAGNIKATTTIHSGAGAGLHIEYPFDTPVQVGTSNFIGAATSFSLSDHVHSHGAQTSGTLHAAATASVNGFMSAADKTKLDASTNANTPSTLVQRDGSGNFSAGTITASLTGAASANVLRAGDTMTGAFNTAVVALTDAVTITTDASLGNIFTVTLADNRTLAAPTNPTNGQKITYRITQDATGNRTLAFNAIFNFGSFIGTFAVSTGANKVDYIGCIYNSATVKWDVVAFSKGF